jgi:hypothetical protein
VFSRRSLMTVLAAVLLLTGLAGPAAAAKPTRHPPGERPLTPEEEAASQRRIAAAIAYLGSPEARDSELSSLACVTPTSAGEETSQADTASATDAGPSTDAGTAGCYTPQGFLAVEARDQIAGHYCGPAVGQVIANYSWAMGTGSNKYTQGVIAGWMSTDVNGRTDAPQLEAGLEKATAGAPRRPAGWDWVITNLRDSDGDGTVGDQLHEYLRSNVSYSKMPLAIPVKPYEKNAAFHLSSWARPVASVGHWIAAYGWVGLWNGTDSARLYYADSSRDEGGSTGKFWDPTRHIGVMISVHTGRFVW